MQLRYGGLSECSGGCTTLTRTEPTSSLYRLLWGTPLRRLIMSLFVTVVSFAMGGALGVRYMLGTIALFGLILILSEWWDIDDSPGKKCF
jgi:hypothetical protein